MAQSPPKRRRAVGFGRLLCGDRARQQPHLVTRNVKDFAPFGVTLFNPWDE
jgi:hypothetical protein